MGLAVVGGREGEGASSPHLSTLGKKFKVYKGLRIWKLKWVVRVWEGNLRSANASYKGLRYIKWYITRTWSLCPKWLLNNHPLLPQTTAGQKPAIRPGEVSEGIQSDHKGAANNIRTIKAKRVRGIFVVFSSKTGFFAIILAQGKPSPDSG